MAGRLGLMMLLGRVMVVVAALLLLEGGVLICRSLLLLLLLIVIIQVTTTHTSEIIVRRSCGNWLVILSWWPVLAVSIVRLSSGLLRIGVSACVIVAVVVWISSSSSLLLLIMRDAVLHGLLKDLPVNANCVLLVFNLLLKSYLLWLFCLKKLSLLLNFGFDQYTLLVKIVELSLEFSILLLDIIKILLVLSLNIGQEGNVIFPRLDAWGVYFHDWLLRIVSGWWLMLKCLLSSFDWGYTFVLWGWAHPANEIVYSTD